MEIHELNDYSGSLGATDYLAIDDGDDTGKVSAKRIIDEAVNEAVDQMPPSAFYGTSATSASTATKVVDCSDFTELFTGAIIAVKFTYAQTSTSSVYLNVNSTGAKQVYGLPRSTASTASRLNGAWEAGEVKFFVYDGTYWRIVDQNIITSSELSSLETALGI